MEYNLEFCTMARQRQGEQGGMGGANKGGRAAIDIVKGENLSLPILNWYESAKRFHVLYYS